MASLDSLAALRGDEHAGSLSSLTLGEKTHRRAAEVKVKGHEQRLKYHHTSHVKTALTFNMQIQGIKTFQ